MSAAIRLWLPDGVASEEQEEDISVADAVKQYGEAKRLAPRTRAEYGTMLSKLYAWSAASKHRLRTPMLLGDLTAERLPEFLDWVEENAGGENKANSRNKCLAMLGAVIRWAFDQELLPSMPRLPKSVEARDVAGQYFFTDGEIDSIYWATYKLKSPRGWDLAQPLGAYWRTAIVLFRTYGMDTQALFPYASATECVLRWKHCTSESLPPGRVALVENQAGFLTIKREKTGRTRIVPLDAVVRSHLDLIRPAAADPDWPIMGRGHGPKGVCTAAGGVRPCLRFKTLCESGNVPKKLDVESGEIRDHELKDLRKTCGTMHDANVPETGVRMLGHSTGTVTDRHYSHTLPAMIAAMKTFKHPRAFYSLLDESIRPPELLFAK